MDKIASFLDNNEQDSLSMRKDAIERKSKKMQPNKQIFTWRVSWTILNSSRVAAMVVVLYRETETEMKHQVLHVISIQECASKN